MLNLSHSDLKLLDFAMPSNVKAHHKELWWHLCQKSTGPISLLNMVGAKLDNTAMWFSDFPWGYLYSL